MELFAKGKFSESITSFRAQIQSFDMTKDHHKIEQLLCSIATAEFVLELYRKSISTCDEGKFYNNNLIVISFKLTLFEAVKL